jgi:hypothetical protein
MREDELDDPGSPSPSEPGDDGDGEPIDLAQQVALPPRYLQLARMAQDTGSWTARMLAADSLPVRLAVYLKLLGPVDDCYPGEWLDPATGALPTMSQLAALDQVSLPTLRKRRAAAIARLAAAARGEGG